MVSHERSIPYPPYSHDEESAHPGASDPGGRGHDSFTCRGQALTSAFSRPAAPAAEACVRQMTDTIVRLMQFGVIAALALTGAYTLVIGVRDGLLRQRISSRLHRDGREPTRGGHRYRRCRHCRA